jgi:hypothetical protein
MMRSFGAIDFIPGGTIWAALGNTALNIGVNLGQSQLTQLLNPTASGSAPIPAGSYAPATGVVANTTAAQTGALGGGGVTAPSALYTYLPWAIGGMGLLLLVVILKK